jgi:hypothetical protein
MYSWNVGDKIRFRGEKQRYTVQAVSERFAVLTKPFNPRRTVLYTIVDFEKQIRGTENLIFCMGFETSELCLAEHRWRNSNGSIASE